MARINFEDEIGLDPRFKRLVRQLGCEDKANGMLLRFWRIAQKYWGDECALVPREVFELEQLDAILDCRLAEAQEKGVYAVGSEEQFDWYLQRCRANRARAESRRAKAEADIAGLKKSAPPTVPEVRNRVQEPVPVVSPSLALAPSLAPAQKKEEEAPTISQDGLDRCKRAWQSTLQRFKQARGVIASEETMIARAIREHGADTVELALFGASYEPSFEGWKPSEHVNLARVLLPDKESREPRIQKFVGYGAKERARMSEIVTRKTFEIAVPDATPDPEGEARALEIREEIKRKARMHGVNV